MPESSPQTHKQASYCLNSSLVISRLCGVRKLKTFPICSVFFFHFQSCAIIEVTDGWYGIRAILDRPLTRLLHDGKIVVGQKLFVYGAELIGSEQAVSPLEVHFSS